MEIDILDFVEECRHLAKQALGKHVHVVIHCFRREDGRSFRETENRLEYLTALLEVLDLGGDVSNFTTLKVTTLTDTESLAVLDVQCHA